MVLLQPLHQANGHDRHIDRSSRQRKQNIGIGVIEKMRRAEKMIGIETVLWISPFAANQPSTVLGNEAAARRPLSCLSSFNWLSFRTQKVEPMDASADLLGTDLRYAMVEKGPISKLLSS